MCGPPIVIDSRAVLLGRAVQPQTVCTMHYALCTMHSAQCRLSVAAQCNKLTALGTCYQIVPLESRRARLGEHLWLHFKFIELATLIGSQNGAACNGSAGLMQKRLTLGASLVSPFGESYGGTRGRNYWKIITFCPHLRLG